MIFLAYKFSDVYPVSKYKNANSYNIYKQENFMFR